MNGDHIFITLEQDRYEKDDTRVAVDCNTLTVIQSRKRPMLNDRLSRYVKRSDTTNILEFNDSLKLIGAKFKNGLKNQLVIELEETDGFSEMEIERGVKRCDEIPKWVYEMGGTSKC